MSLRTNLVVIVAAVVLTGCGDDAAETADTVSVPPTPSATATPPPAAETTPTPGSGYEPPPAPAGTAAPPTPTPGGEGGDESGNRVDLAFDVGGPRVQPDRIEVPAFLGLRVVLRNQGGEPRPVDLDRKPLTMVLPGATETVVVEGLRPGDHVLRAAGGGRATIVAVRAGG